MLQVLLICIIGGTHCAAAHQHPEGQACAQLSFSKGACMAYARLRETRDRTKTLERGVCRSCFSGRRRGALVLLDPLGGISVERSLRRAHSTLRHASGQRTRIWGVHVVSLTACCYSRVSLRGSRSLGKFVRRLHTVLPRYLMILEKC